MEWEYLLIKTKKVSIRNAGKITLNEQDHCKEYIKIYNGKMMGEISSSGKVIGRENLGKLVNCYYEDNKCLMPTYNTEHHINICCNELIHFKNNDLYDYLCMRKEKIAGNIELSSDLIIESKEYSNSYNVESNFTKTTLIDKMDILRLDDEAKLKYRVTEPTNHLMQYFTKPFDINLLLQNNIKK